MSTIDLRKKTVIDLKKSMGIEGQVAQVSLCMDFSGSMYPLYQNGTVQKLVERILPIGLAFDDNGEIDFYKFENGCKKISTNVTLNNYVGYVDKYVNKGNMGGTSYTPIIKSVMSDLGVDIDSEIGGKSFMSGLFGKKKTALEPKLFKHPAYVIVITDGENDDHSLAEQAIIKASHYGAFFQFVGIGNETFKFLKKLDNLSGRLIDNANFFSVPNVDSLSDDQLYRQLLNEFPDWLKQAKIKNLI